MIIIGAIALIAGSYCFYLMTVPLSYDFVYIVIGGFLLSIVVSAVTTIATIVLAIKSRPAKPN